MSGISEAAGQSIITGIVGLLGACIGAWLSYFFGRRQKLADIAKDNVEKGNRALFVLFRQVNTLAYIKSAIFDKFENNRLRFFLPLPLAYEQDPFVAVDCESLSFFMQSDNAKKQLVFDISITNEKYKTLILLINRRSVLYAEVKNKLSPAKIPEGTPLTEEYIKDILGDVLFTELHDITEIIYNNFSSYILEIEELKTKLRSALLDLFPGEIFIDFTRLQP